MPRLKCIFLVMGERTRVTLRKPDTVSCHFGHPITEMRLQDCSLPLGSYRASRAYLLISEPLSDLEHLFQELKLPGSMVFSTQHRRLAGLQVFAQK